MFDDNAIEDIITSFFATAIEQIMMFIWAAAVNLLRGSFELVDGLLGFGDGSDLIDGSGQLGSAAPQTEGEGSGRPTPLL